MLAKFWKLCGFGCAEEIQLPENPALPYFHGFQFVMPITLATALRAVVSRRIHMGVASLTDAEIKLAESAVSIAVLAPGYKGS